MTEWYVQKGHVGDLGSQPCRTSQAAVKLDNWNFSGSVSAAVRCCCFGFRVWGHGVVGQHEGWDRCA